MVGMLSKPGFSRARLLRLMRESISRTHLDLSGLTILTEAATGAYCVTPILAALSGATRVCAVTKQSRYGSVEDVIKDTMSLAELGGVESRIQIEKSLPSDLSCFDIVTNSGHLRPIGESLINALPQRCVLALMFEAWEFRSSDIDLAACRRRNIPIVGVNERHKSVDVFSFLGPLAVNMLHEAGIAVYSSKIAILSDNDFGNFISHSLAHLGATIGMFVSPETIPIGDWDAVLIALKPGTEDRIDAASAKWIASVAPTAVVVQMWGDIDRGALEAEGLAFWPVQSPSRGHMAVLLSAIGPEPIVRLQAGGLRAAEWVFRGNDISPGGIAELV
jgi:hypothetical protein